MVVKQLLKLPCRQTALIMQAGRRLRNKLADLKTLQLTVAQASSQTRDGTVQIVQDAKLKASTPPECDQAGAAQMIPTSHLLGQLVLKL